MGSPASRQLVIDVSGQNPETMTTIAVRDALRAHLGSTKFIPRHCLQRGYESSLLSGCVAHIHGKPNPRADAGDDGSRGHVRRLRSDHADGSLFSSPPEQGRSPKEKAKVQPPPQQPPSRPQPPCHLHLRLSHCRRPSCPRVPPRPRPGPQRGSPPRTGRCSRQHLRCGLPKGRASSAPGGTDYHTPPHPPPRGYAARASPGRWWSAC